MAFPTRVRILEAFKIKMSTKETFATILARLRTDDPAMTSINLRGRGIGTPGASSLAEALADKPREGHELRH